MKITVITLFPQMFSGPFDYSIVKNALDKNFADLRFVNLREFGEGKHKTVDDTPYGGGVGMLIKPDVVLKAIEASRDKNLSKNEEKVILTSASGESYSQEKAKEYKNLKHLIIICGHYEGIDSRIKKYVDGEVSIGNYVLTGGELPAMVIIDSVVRLIPGVLKDDATNSESFSENDTLEYPQYTKPRDFNGDLVPNVLLSGNHSEIEKWKKENLKKKN